MPTATYIPLQTITLGSSASSVTFGSIPNTYKDLVVVFNGNNTGAAGGTRIRFNSDSGNNYSNVEMYGDGSSSGSVARSSESFALAGYHLNTGRYVIVSQVMDYSATDKHKTVLSRDSLAAEVVRAVASRWANTSAVTSLTVVTETQSFASGSTFSLYGIAG